ncbi:hypothetical protein [Glycomyces buryatensis]|uniref:Uncharacterized protein n=1 Tax=Glycomyces buryatensis TaxID=2570927 RepID=A0A4S8QGM8_9ACTN|nr:hypothetical protein [Glycomyces buryatensis]THV42125.1 hypothetical protein FAB82_07740 [Glycomyces buryatensis]
MPEPSSKQHQRNTSLYLQELLASESYSFHWRRYPTERQRQLPRISVARVLAGYLLRRGETFNEKGIRDKVSRAFSSREPIIPEDTLKLFIQAFEISDIDAETLRKLRRGEGLQRVAVRDLPEPENGLPPPPPYQIIGLREYHYIGSDGNPTIHRTIRDIRSTADRLESIRYTFDTDQVDVKQINGGTPSDPYLLPNGLSTVDITLPRPLGIADDHSIEFVTRFKNRELLDPNFRRVAHRRIEGLSIRVEFHPECLPAKVWWAEWKDYRPPNDEVISRQPVALDAEHAVYHRLHAAERAVVGFEWEFSGLEG